MCNVMVRFWCNVLPWLCQNNEIYFYHTGVRITATYNDNVEIYPVIWMY